MLQSVKESHRLLRAWQLALLRFAVTLDESDMTLSLIWGAILTLVITLLARGLGV